MLLDDKESVYFKFCDSMIQKLRISFLQFTEKSFLV